MTEEIIIDKEEFWDAFEQHPINAVDGLFSKIEMIVNLLKRLEQENKRLKEVNQSLSMLGTDLASANETVRKEFFRADKNKDMWREKAEEYRSALEEIREKIESLNKDICNNCGWHNTDNCQPNGYVCHDLIEILNKINEVIKCQNL